MIIKYYCYKHYKEMIKISKDYMKTSFSALAKGQYRYMSQEMNLFLLYTSPWWCMMSQGLSGIICTSFIRKYVLAIDFPRHGLSRLKGNVSKEVLNRIVDQIVESSN